MAVPTKISLVDYNQFRNSVDSVMGVTDLGYGITSLNALPVNSQLPVSERHWRPLIVALNYAARHQTGSYVSWEGTDTFNLNLAPAKIGSLTTGTRVLSSFTNFLNSQALTLSAIPQRFTVAPEELGPLNTENGVSERTTAWTNMTHLVRVSWLTTATAQHFFNLGGSIDVQAMATNAPVSPEDSAWAAILASVGTRTYNRTDYVGPAVKYYPSVSGVGLYSGYRYDLVVTRDSDQRSLTLAAYFNSTQSPPQPVLTSSLVALPVQATWTVFGADPNVSTVGLNGAGTYSDSGVGSSSITLTLNSDGGLVIVGANRGLLLNTSWVNTVVGGVGSRYWARFSLVSNTGSNERATTPSTGWINLASGASVVASATGVNLRGNSQQNSQYLVEISASSGGAVLSSAVYNLGAVATANVFSPVNPLPGAEFSETDIGQIEVTLDFQADGGLVAQSTTRRSNESLVDTFMQDNWGIPDTAGAGAGYWIRVLRTDDFFDGIGSSSSSPSTGWVNLASGYSFGVVATASNQGNRSHTALYTVDIAVDSNGTNIVASGSYTLTATSAPAVITAGGGGVLVGGVFGGFLTGGTGVPEDLISSVGSGSGFPGEFQDLVYDLAQDDGTTDGINDQIAEDYLNSVLVNDYLNSFENEPAATYEANLLDSGEIEVVKVNPDGSRELIDVIPAGELGAPLTPEEIDAIQQDLNTQGVEYWPESDGGGGGYDSTWTEEEDSEGEEDSTEGN